MVSSLICVQLRFCQSFHQATQICLPGSCAKSQPRQGQIPFEETGQEMRIKGLSWPFEAFAFCKLAALRNQWRRDLSSSQQNGSIGICTLHSHAVPRWPRCPAPGWPRCPADPGNNISTEASLRHPLLPSIDRNLDLCCNHHPIPLLSQNKNQAAWQRASQEHTAAAVQSQVHQFMGKVFTVD